SGWPCPPAALFTFTDSYSRQSSLHLFLGPFPSNQSCFPYCISSFIFTFDCCPFPLPLAIISLLSPLSLCCDIYECASIPPACCRQTRWCLALSKKAIQMRGGGGALAAMARAESMSLRV